MLELGAGCGVIGVALARKTAPENITAIEANPALMPTIDLAYRISGVQGIRMINALVSRTRGPQTF